MLRSIAYTSFAELPSHCLTFLNDVEKTNFFLGSGWFSNFSQNTITADSKTRIYTVEEVSDVPETRAVLFMRAPGGQNGSYSEKHFSGSKTVASMTAHQSISFAPAINPSDEQQEHIINTLIQSICEDKSTWNLIDLNFMDKESSLYKQLSNALSNHGMIVRDYEYRLNLYENLSGTTFKDFVASRPSMVHKTYMRKARKLEKTGSVRFELLQTGDLEQAINDYKTVHDKSWKEAELFPRHDPGVIEASAKAGSLRLGLLYFDDKPVAVQIWIVSSGRATIYKLHYDYNFQQESVGAILMLRMFEHMIDVEHVNEVDFGVGDETAKSYWLKDQRPLCGIVAFNTKTLGGLLALTRFSTAAQISNLKQKLNPILLLLKQRLSKSDK